MKNELCLGAQLIVTSFIAWFLKIENNASSLDCLNFCDGTLFPSVSYAYMLCFKNNERRQCSFFPTTVSPDVQSRN